MQAPAAIILAAGKGTRMGGDLPKCAAVCAGQSMVRWVADTCVEAGCGKIVVVVGYRQEIVREIFEKNWSHDAEVVFAEQTEQLGTGHATACAKPALEGFDGPVFVLAGDGPLVLPATLAELHKTMEAQKAAVALATCELDDPTGYGRIVRDANGGFARIVEQKEATDEQAAIREVNVSLYCFQSQALWQALSKVQRSERTGEYYLTDAPKLLDTQGKRVALLDGVPAETAVGVNTPVELAAVETILLARSGKTAATNG